MKTGKVSLSAGLQRRRLEKELSFWAARRAVWMCSFRAWREGGVKVRVRRWSLMVHAGAWRIERKVLIVEGWMSPRAEPG